MWALTHRHRELQIEWPKATNPSDSTWETPRTLVPSSQFDHNTGKVTDVVTNATPRAEVLDRARGELKRLCCPGVPLSDLQTFLVKWKDPEDPNYVQPNALAWFQYAAGLSSTALGTAVGYDRIDAVRLLLQKGLKPTETDVSWALRAFERTGNRTAIEMFRDAGWDINQPVNEHTAPLLG